jgi:hypothetical protein
VGPPPAVGGGSDRGIRAGSGGPPLLLAVISASLLALGLFAIALVVRRRRADEPALEPVVTGSSYAETRGLVAAAIATDVPIEELGIPRWRRPSLRAARGVADRSGPIEHVPVRFGRSTVPGGPRRRVGYRLVRMSTEPDELRGAEVGRLDRGDEVEVLREEASYVLVLTPDETIGWVHRTTLEEAAGSSEPDEPSGPGASSPESGGG